MKHDPAQTFQDLVAWRRAHEFVFRVYRETECFPKTEIYGLTPQFRRAAMSVPANIAEGFKKTGKSDKLRFLNIAQGSLEECQYYFILARDLGYGECAEAWPLLEEASRLIHSYAGAIRRKLVGQVAALVVGVGLVVSSFCLLYPVS